jgi:hypothetical protein
MHTLLYYTASRKPEGFAQKIREELLISSGGGFPIISVSQKPLNFGKNICVGEIGASTYNVYKQILLGLREVKTKWTVCCEDDTLYSSEHLFFEPPSEDTVYYNINKWTIDPRVFWLRKRTGMCMCIAATKLLRDCLEERLAKYKNPNSAWIKYFSEPGKYEHHLRIFEPPYVQVDLAPSITFNHKPCLGGVRRLCPDDIVVEELPLWGRASELWNRIVKKEENGE